MTSDNTDIAEKLRTALALTKLKIEQTALKSLDERKPEDILVIFKQAMKYVNDLC